MAAFIFVLLVLLQPAISTVDLNFSFVLAGPAVDPVYGVSLRSTVPAVDEALQLITNAANLLPDISLSYEEPRIQQCINLGRLIDFGIIGNSCEESYVIEAPQVVFSPSSKGEVSSDANTGVYRLHPTSNSYAEAVYTILRQFNWQRLAVMTRGGRFFNETWDALQEGLQNSSIMLIEGNQDGSRQVEFPADVRIFFLNMDLSNAAEVMCQAFSAGMLFPRYVWITYSRDYLQLVTEQQISCSREELTRFLDGVLLLQSTVVNPAFNNVQQELMSVSPGTTFSLLLYFAFDAVWTLAHALNHSMENRDLMAASAECVGVSNNGTGIVDNCLLGLSLSDISISGITGDISFNSSGSRENHVLGLSQLRAGSGQETLMEQLIATLTLRRAEEAAFNFIDGENETTLFRGPVPADGTPIKVIHITPLPLVIIYSILAVAGIIFTIVCFFFTIIFRKRKVVRLTSPNLNYFIIFGALLLYGLIIFRVFPSDSLPYREFLCHFLIITADMGYVFCMAPVLMKMWRVFYIFRNPHPAKKAIKDWHLFVGVSILAAIMALLLLLGVVVPILSPNPVLVPNEEERTGTNEDGITINFCVYSCYSGQLPALVWATLASIYQYVLQAAALILALATRKVEIKVLNDYKEMSIIVYSTTVLLIILAIVIWAVNAYVITSQVLYSGLLMMATTIFMVFVFVPKMVLLYKNPKGENILGSSKVRRDTTTSEGTVRRETMVSETTEGAVRRETMVSKVGNPNATNGTSSKRMEALKSEENSAV